MNLPRKLQRGDPYGVMFDLWNQLIDYLRASRLVPGAGIRLQTRAAGIVIEAVRRGGSPAPGSAAASAAGESYTGPFALSVVYDEETGEAKAICVSAGYLNCNGSDFREVAAAELAIQSGTVCLKSTLQTDGQWSTPEITYGTPGQFSYPLGKVAKDGESLTVESYHVATAILLSSKACPLAKSSG